MQIIAVNAFDCCPGDEDFKGIIEVILVILDYQPRLMSHVKTIGKLNVVIVAVDKWIFEKDIQRGFLGEATVGTLFFPHISIAGENYLLSQEIKLKKRLILEFLESLVIGFPTLAMQMRITPEYFMFEAMVNRVRLFPPLVYSTATLIENVKDYSSTVLNSYIIALRELANERKIVFSDGYVLIPKDFGSASSRRKMKLTKISKTAPRAIFTSLLEVFPQLLNFLAKSKEGMHRLQALTGKENEAKSLVDPREFIFVPTASGLVSLADRTSVDDFARKVLLKRGKGEVSIKPVGGMLNDVYLAEAGSNGNVGRLLIKRFKDWSGIKWLPLNIWALGARSFAVLGRARLERECAINELLRKEGFNTPRILHISHGKRLVIMEYIEGKSLTFTLRQLAASKDVREAERDLQTISKVGQTLSRVHSLDIVLGDAKPENIIVSGTGEIYLLDFEQASTDGDKAWDVAELLYYSGHYFSSSQGNDRARAFTVAFISGYIMRRGDPSVIRKAGTAKYSRVFSVFVLPSIILTISKACRSVDSLLDVDSQNCEILKRQ